MGFVNCLHTIEKGISKPFFEIKQAAGYLGCHCESGRGSSKILETLIQSSLDGKLQSSLIVMCLDQK